MDDIKHQTTAANLLYPHHPIQAKVKKSAAQKTVTGCLLSSFTYASQIVETTTKFTDTTVEGRANV